MHMFMHHSGHGHHHAEPPPSDGRRE
ncbi:hypothetical protein [Bradyrhizobium liaoningense]